MTIRVAIAGYGNLGRGVELAVDEQGDMQLVGVFTRRDPQHVQTLGAPAHKLSDIEKFKNDIDVVILCGGSRNDLPEQTPALAASFNVVDSFDNHTEVPAHFDRVNRAATEARRVALISVGWDPGLFSLNRVLAEAVLPRGETYTFWGKGLSQGHSDAVRRVAGVADAVQYTVPSEEAMDRVRAGEEPTLSTREKHKRVCYVALDGSVPEANVEAAIVNMPDYFEPYETTVHFVTANEIKQNHSGMPHGGFVIRSGKTGGGNTQTIDYSLKLRSNPEFTASVLVAYARACKRLAESGEVGARTVFDVAPALLSPRSPEELRRDFL